MIAVIFHYSLNANQFISSKLLFQKSVQY